jgi:hypothetical protein
MSAIAIVGSRGFAAIEDYVGLVLDREPDAHLLISGGARGVDRAAEEEAARRNLAVVSLRPRQVSGGYVVDRYEDGRRVWTVSEPTGIAVLFDSFTAAAKQRNYWIVWEAKGGVHALWDGYSGGTAHAIAAALRTRQNPPPRIWMQGDS